MPELPDIEVYLTALENLVGGRKLDSVRVAHPFLVRSVTPPLASVAGRTVTVLRRIGKRIAIGFDNDRWLVLHLVVARRLHWKAVRPSLAGKQKLAAFDFEHGSLLLIETGTKKRASLHVVAGEAGLTAHDRGGLEPLTASRDQFDAALRAENHTLKRALTDPRLLSGIGNAYSDEILHAARLSPALLTQKLDETQMQRLYEATLSVLQQWRRRLIHDAHGTMPEKVTAFRDGMAVHGRFGKPCPVCGGPVQRIRYKDNETNYCAGCQTGSRILKDRSLSRVLKADWPETLDEL